MCCDASLRTYFRVEIAQWKVSNIIYKVVIKIINKPVNVKEAIRLNSNIYGDKHET